MATTRDSVILGRLSPPGLRPSG